jgi:hypothetical protein
VRIRRERNPGLANLSGGGVCGRLALGINTDRYMKERITSVATTIKTVPIK